MKKEEITDKEEVVTEETKKKKKPYYIIVIIILLLLAFVYYMIPFMLFSKNDKLLNKNNIDYLTKTYGNNLKISFISKRKKTWKYEICSGISGFCVDIKYKNKKWIYPYGEGFIYTLLFVDQAITVLDNNHVDYKLYGNNQNTLVKPSKLILVLKKDNDSNLINAIREINNSKFINLLCSKSDEKNCTGEMEINIFNSDDYNLITSSIKNSYGVNGYYEFYQLLYDNSGIETGAKLGNNVVRHNIGNDMFSCNIAECNNYKHLAYRYVIGNHNTVGNTIIVEGL